MGERPDGPREVDEDPGVGESDLPRSAVTGTPLAWPRKAAASLPMAGLAAMSSAPASWQSLEARISSMRM